VITFQTNNSAGLLRLFDEAIAKGSATGGIATWEKIGSYYTHRADRWAKKAYFTATAGANGLIFNIVKNKASNITVLVYGYYHGHLLETFLNHFDKKFIGASCTPVCEAGDICSAAA
jgi:hypothetical protein